MPNKILLIILLPLIIAPPVIYLFFKFRHTVYAGPWPDETVRDMLYERVKSKYGTAASVSAGIGLFIGSLGASSWVLVDFIIALMIGWPAGSFWSRYVMRNAEIKHAGPDPSVPDEKLFPSDHIAKHWYEGQVNPSPLWKDMLFLAASEIIGVLIGLSFLLIWLKIR
ncbi:MAG: hypothetical protein ACYC27_20050 [Armatimonadota bacterium]